MKPRTKRRAATLGLLGALTLCQARQSAAEEETNAADNRYVPDVIKSDDKPKVKGWDGDLSIGASFNIASNSNVVGRAEGTALAFGGKLDGGLRYLGGPHEWRNVLKLAQMFTRTPAINDLQKTTDEFEIVSTYLYHIRSIPWLGPFGRLKFRTAIFELKDIRADRVDYEINRLDGSTETVADTNELRLSDPFSPLTLRESAGVFAKAYDKQWLGLEFKAALAGLQTFAKGQLALDETTEVDGGRDIVSVNELDNVFQGGVGLGVDATGKLADSGVVYTASAEAMLPVLNNLPEEDERGVWDLLNVAFEVDLSMRVVSWFSVDYQFKALREPQLLDRWQVQNNLLLTFSYALVEAKPVPSDKKKEGES